MAPGTRKMVVSRMDMPADQFPDLTTESGFRALARRALDTEPSPAIFDPRSGRAWGPSDWDLNPELKGDLAVMDPPRPAAVLVPIVLRPQLTVLLTQRSQDMPSHPGQISFPGGKVEECDVNSLACALREAQEEIGLPPENVEPLGYLDSYRTGTGFQITPVVALRAPGLRAIARSARGAGSLRGAARLPDGRGQPPEGTRASGAAAQRSFYAMPYEGRYIWGATAGMLKNMHDRLFRR